ncbi:hypothetical protein ANCDUO_16975 [Ancylostoma duodenale]|uniref:Uncharacterized protein n=1 Tax=Ancylostoma duodenale TaxID=51022 RepID=A0A0C2G206_9BILA|nr:hypothetical protein ANCDUO_16975 [Ancylostoma duodenale]
MATLVFWELRRVLLTVTYSLYKKQTAEARFNHGERRNKAGVGDTPFNLTYHQFAIMSVRTARSMGYWDSVKALQWPTCYWRWNSLAKSS